MSELQDLFAHLGDQVHKLFGLLFIAGDRFTTNLTASFTTMELKHWIRIVMIVGTYLLVRPHIVKFGAKQQEKQFEKENDEADAAAISPNQLRGQVDIPEDSDDDDAQDPATAASASTTSADWGKKARKRQRTMLKKMIDAEEKRLQELQEDEEDKDIAQYLQ